jgi:hypothetical protein
MYQNNLDHTHRQLSIRNDTAIVLNAISTGHAGLASFHYAVIFSTFNCFYNCRYAAFITIVTRLSEPHSYVLLNSISIKYPQQMLLNKFSGNPEIAMCKCNYCMNIDDQWNGCYWLCVNTTVIKITLWRERAVTFHR